MDLDDLKQELEEIDRRLARLPQGQVVVRKSRGQERAWRLWKDGSKDRFELLGEVDGDEHLRMVSMLQERRDLSRRRRVVAKLLL